jgi:hypothetical protein
MVPETVATLETSLRLGTSILAACGLAGISRETFYAWMDRGERDPDGPYGDFFRRIRRAQAEPQQALVARVRAAAQDPKHYGAATWMLERRWPEEWGENKKVTVISGDVAGEYAARYSRAAVAAAVRLGLDGDAFEAALLDELELDAQGARNVTPGAVGGG